MGFDADGCKGGEVNPVYIKVASDIYEIFPTSYDACASCSLIGSPSEMGKETLDQKVIRPTSISFTGVLKKEHFDKLNDFIDHIKSSDLQELIKCTFYSKGRTWEKMMIEEFHEIGNPDRYDAVEVSVRLHEFLSVE